MTLICILRSKTSAIFKSSPWPIWKFHHRRGEIRRKRARRRASRGTVGQARRKLSNSVTKTTTANKPARFTGLNRAKYWRKNDRAATSRSICLSGHRESCSKTMIAADLTTTRCSTNYHRIINTKWIVKYRGSTRGRLWNSKKRTWLNKENKVFITRQQRALKIWCTSFLITTRGTLGSSRPIPTKADTSQSLNKSRSSAQTLRRRALAHTFAERTSMWIIWITLSSLTPTSWCLKSSSSMRASRSARMKASRQVGRTNHRTDMPRREKRGVQGWIPWIEYTRGSFLCLSEVLITCRKFESSTRGMEPLALKTTMSAASRSRTLYSMGLLEA